MRAIPSFGHKRQHQADQEFANTLALLAEAATNGLRDRLRAVFAHFYDSLFEQASVSDDASEHVFNLAMLREVKSQQLDINERFCAEIKCHFQALTAKVVPIANSTEAGRIAGSGVEAAFVKTATARWQAVGTLFKQILTDLGTHRHQRVELNPLARALLMRIFIRCFDDRELSGRLRSQLLSSFDRHLLQQIDQVYLTVLNSAEANGLGAEFKKLRTLIGQSPARPVARYRQGSWSALDDNIAGLKDKPLGRDDADVTRLSLVSVTADLSFRCLMLSP